MQESRAGTLLAYLRAAARRLGAAVHLALGVALLGGVLGALAGGMLPVGAEPLLPRTAPAANRLVSVTSGAFLGWWLGLLGGAAWLAVRRRR
jgi:hypothetical protein